MQRLVGHYMRRGGRGVEGGFEPLSELRWVEQGETGVADLEEDLDKVKRKPKPGATGMVSSSADRTAEDYALDTKCLVLKALTDFPPFIV